MEAAGDRPGREGPARGDPWFLATVQAPAGSRRLRLAAPRSVFSGLRVDAGTLLLLGNLPTGQPRTFLDLGCGYGALGLPLAVRFPGARGLLTDRDLLAVEFCRRNAAAEAVANVEVAPGLGYGSIPPDRTFDWILSNVPARAGGRVFGHFLEEGIARLAPGGEMRLVVIAPLSKAVQDAAAARGLAVRAVASGEGHVVLAAPRPAEPFRPPLPEEPLEAYERDRIELALPERLRLTRPTDLADEPHRLPGIELLAGRLPSEAPGRVLVFRCGYGLVPALALARWPGARVASQDRDLLGTAYTRLNGAAAADRLETVESVEVAAAAGRGPFDLVLGELSPPNGAAATLREVEDARSLLAPGGRGLVLGLQKQWREVLEPRRQALGLDLVESRPPVALIGIRRLEA